MAKRFTDTDKWKDGWFTELEPSMKIFWIYLCDTCDHAGIWKVNFRVASSIIGCLLDRQSALKAFGSRIVEITEDKWLLVKFIPFQYPKGLNNKNSVHRGVLKLLEYNDIDHSPYLAPSEDLPSSSVGAKDKDMDKDMDSSSFSSSLKQGAKKNLSEKDSQDKPKSEFSVNVIKLFNSLCFADYKVTPSLCELIDARASEGFTLQDFKAVINHKKQQWANDARMSPFFRPETIFGEKMNSYLQETKNVIKFKSEASSGLTPEELKRSRELGII